MTSALCDGIGAPGVAAATARTRSEPVSSIAAFKSSSSASVAPAAEPALRSTSSRSFIAASTISRLASRSVVSADPAGSGCESSPRPSSMGTRASSGSRGANCARATCAARATASKTAFRSGFSVLSCARGAAGTPPMRVRTLLARSASSTRRVMSACMFLRHRIEFESPKRERDAT